MSRADEFANELRERKLYSRRMAAAALTNAGVKPTEPTKHELLEIGKAITSYPAGIIDEVVEFADALLIVLDVLCACRSGCAVCLGGGGVMTVREAIDNAIQFLESLGYGSGGDIHDDLVRARDKVMILKVDDTVYPEVESFWKQIPAGDATLPGEER